MKHTIYPFLAGRATAAGVMALAQKLETKPYARFPFLFRGLRRAELMKLPRAEDDRRHKTAYFM